MLRLIKGLTLFDVHAMMRYVKSIYKKKALYIIENQPEVASDLDIDSTNIG